MSGGKWIDHWKEKYGEKYKDKNTWLIIGIVGLLLLVIALPSGKTVDAPGDLSGDAAAADQVAAGDQTEAVPDTAVQTAAEDLEHRLEETLSLIDGAGRVRVMLTLKDHGEKVVEKDTARRVDDRSDTDADAGAEDTSESTVYTKNGSAETPYVSNQLTPQVEGVLVVAQGGGNSMVKQNILQSVMALFPLEAHKITIVKMSMQEVSEHENF